jgi:sugar lactone lactonase YvrE
MLFITDQSNHRIRKVNAGGVITTVAGNGNPGFFGDDAAATSASLNLPIGTAVDAAGNLYIADTSNHRIRRVSADGMVTTVAGNGIGGFSGDGSAGSRATLNSPGGVAVDAAGNLYIADSSNNRIRKLNTIPSVPRGRGPRSPGQARKVQGPSANPFDILRDRMQAYSVRTKKGLLVQPL